MNPDQQFQQQTSQYEFNIKQQPPSRGRGSAGTQMKTSSQEQRPMTSVQAVGFQDKSQKYTQAILLDKVSSNSPEETFKKLEKEINSLVEESALAAVRDNPQLALEKAKEAMVKDRNLTKQKEQANVIDSINLELTYCVSFNLAVQYQNNGMFQEALVKYNEIIKSKQFPQAGRLKQKKYSLAIKMFRMALDSIQVSSKEMRCKIQKNIGLAFVKLGSFHEAISTFENIMKQGADFPTAFNLLLCLYAQGDKHKMKDCFCQLLSIEIPGLLEAEEAALNNEDTTQTDKLRDEIKEKKRQAFKYIIDSAKLIAPIIESDVIQGYDFILEILKTSNYPEVEMEIEVCKAMAYLQRKEIEKAIETLKGFEKKDKKIMAKAISNISFLYFLEEDYQKAEKYAESAYEYDRFNAKVLVNRGNCFFVKNDFLRAKEQYLEAIGVEADCIEALYNLAFVNKKLNMFVEALQALEKLQTIVSTLPEVLYMIASIYELMGHPKQALKWYQILNTKVPNDPNILSSIGALFSREDDENQALHYFSESYKLLPTNLETISWLGIYYVKHELYEKSCQFFSRASQIQPKEVKWKLMVASCYRRMGNYQQALNLYESINKEFPNNIECLRFIVQISKEMGQPYDEYAAQLKKIERELDAQPNFEAPAEQNIQYQSQQQQYYKEDDIPDSPVKVNLNLKRDKEKRLTKQQNFEDEAFNNEDPSDLLQ